MAEPFLLPPRTASSRTNLRDAARLMEKYHVGYLVVVENERPVGMVTDRDIALHVLAERADPTTSAVATCMSQPLITLREGEGLAAASQLMLAHKVRRLPIVDQDGRLTGVVLADQLIRMVGREVADLADAVQRGLEVEARPPDQTSIFGKE